MKKTFTLLFFSIACLIFKGNSQTQCNLAVSYSLQAETVQTNIIHFTNTSTGYVSADTLLWTFGDGTTSADPNPIHTYITSATYHVCLIIKKAVPPGAAPCQNYSCHDIIVTFPVSCTLSAAFTSQPSTSNPLSVYFTNTSTGFAAGDSIRWNFGDGTVSYELNPFHTYANEGTYTVCIRVQKHNSSPTAPPCVSEICHVITVTASTTCNLAVSYSWQAETVQTNIIHFTNTSTGYVSGDTLLWTFGDGTTSADPNPIHTYITSATYHVCLIIKKAVPPGAAPCQNYSCHDIIVTFPVSCTLSAAFTSQPSTSNPLSVYFTNTSTGFAAGDSIRWNFGDGTVSYELNPFHTYANAGTYTVCIRVQKHNSSPTAPPCVSEICHVITVTAATTCTLSAAFISQPSTSNPLGVYFTNTSTGFAAGDSIRWNFGDGTVSYELNPFHTYANAGTYTVCIRVQKHNSSPTAPPCVSEICHVITVTAATTCTLSAAFISQPSTSNPLSVYFTNTSTGFAAGDSIRWNFGDGTVSYELNPFHTYANAGTYTVCIRVQKHNSSPTAPPCVSEICHVITVTAATTCTLSAAFISQPSTSNPLGVYFTNTSTGFAAGDSIRWNFGDGTVSYELNPFHTYANAGTYTVCIRVQKHNSSPTAPPCVSEICHVITVTAATTCTLSAAFISQPSTSNPLSVYFTNTSTGFAAGDSIRWNFGDGTVSYELNPFHTYANAGTYTVCIRVQKHNSSPTAPPCVSEICHVITVTAATTCTLSAAFISQPSTSNPLSVYFTNTSTGFAAGDSIRWNFGDGTVSYELNPFHTYANAGTYTVCIRVQKHNSSPTAPPCVSEICHVITVTAATTCTLSAAFISQPSTSNPLSVYFTNTSTGFAAGDSIRWNFGDGTVSYELNPFHTYANAGTYTVCIRVQKHNSSPTAPPCVSEICHVITVTAATTCTLSAAFISQPSTSNPLGVYFTNTSTGFAAGDSIRWNFGDGTVSYELNPFHTYANAGTYTVCIRVQKHNSSPTAPPCVSEICHVITVTAATTCTLSAAFISQPSTSNPLSVYFTNTSTGFAAGDSIRWNFGDGTVSYELNPFHTYANAGTYTVCIRVQKHNSSPTAPPCVSEICHVITVTAATTCTLSAAFISQPSTSNPLGVYFTNTSTGFAAGDSIRWNFGDGTVSYELNPFHTYANAGTYTVCIRVQKHNSSPTAPPCVSEICHTVTITSACGNIDLNFTDHRDSLMPNTISFTAYSNLQIVSQTWTITPVQPGGTGVITINQNNPTYTFADTGNYHVCLHAIFAGGCSGEYCNMIHITQIAPPINLCTLQVYPNPVTSTVNMNVTMAQPLMIHGYIYNSANLLVGQRQQQGFVGNNVFTMYTGELPSGHYVIKVIYGNQVCTASFVKL